MARKFLVRAVMAVLEDQQSLDVGSDTTRPARRLAHCITGIISLLLNNGVDAKSGVRLLKAETVNGKFISGRCSVQLALTYFLRHVH